MVVLRLVITVQMTVFNNIGVIDYGYYSFYICISNYAPIVLQYRIRCVYSGSVDGLDSVGLNTKTDSGGKYLRHFEIMSDTNITCY